MQALTPIVTRYAGFKFRSRLEARWAVCLDALGIVYDYEREGFALGPPPKTPYLPDFWLPRLEAWLEIKPDMPEGPSAEEVRKCHFLAQATGNTVYLFHGLPGSDAGGTLCGNGLEDSGYHFCECPVCGEVGIQFGGYCNRMICQHAECRGVLPPGRISTRGTERMIMAARVATEKDFTSETPRVEQVETREGLPEFMARLDSRFAAWLREEREELEETE